MSRQVSLKTFNPEQMVEIQEAASYLGNSQGLPFAVVTAAADAHDLTLPCHVSSQGLPSAFISAIAAAAHKYIADSCQQNPDAEPVSFCWVSKHSS